MYYRGLLNSAAKTRGQLNNASMIQGVTVVAAKKIMNRKWSQLRGSQKAFIVVASIAQITLQVAALRDIARRPAAQINGSKLGWVAASFINFAGPLAYFAKGRR